jgi:phage/plasmid-like protein (TIGR03299 family)
MTQEIHNSVTTSDLPVWKTIGTDIGGIRNGTDAMRLAKLDWIVEQWPVQATDPQSWKTVSAADHLANVRSDTRTLLGVVGKNYHPLHNAQLFEFLDTLVADRLVSYHAAGSLRGGRRVWALCRLPKEFHAADDDVVYPYLLVTNCHDGSGPLQMIPATVRDVCSNSMNLTVGANAGLSIRHHPGLGQGLAEARRNLQLIAGRFERFQHELEALATTQIHSTRVRAYFDSVMPVTEGQRENGGRDKLLARLQENFESPLNSLPGVAGTAWAAFNAVSEWTDHQRTFRGRDDQARAESRLESIWFGGSHRIKRTAYDSALELAGLN